MAGALNRGRHPQTSNYQERNMGLFTKTSGKEVEAFAEGLAESLAKRYPPAMDAAEKRKVSANRLTKILEDALGKAAAFQSEKQLGWYKKAAFGNAFRWKLKDLGYSERFIEVATEGLIVYISRKQEK
jgi:hypothetical protein